LPYAPDRPRAEVFDFWEVKGAQAWGSAMGVGGITRRNDESMRSTVLAGCTVGPPACRLDTTAAPDRDATANDGEAGTVDLVNS
jgi:hypothetical protein